jgi:outer membrane protein insertion porin family
VRGFEIWGISPLAFLPSEATINVLNDDGSPRQQKNVDAKGNITYTPVTQKIPTYQLIFPGGDTQAVSNFEYRIPLGGPVTLAAFFDAGWDKISLPTQLTLTQERVAQLNSEFPQAGFKKQVTIVPGTQEIRTSTGLEVQVLLPVVNAPFRVYWAYNPTIIDRGFSRPIVFDRSMFPNQATFNSAVINYGMPIPPWEQRRTFRFTVGRTF